MSMSGNRKSLELPLFVTGVFAAFILMLTVPASRSVFEQATKSHPFFLGFFKFALLALAGECLAARIREGRWISPGALPARFVIWGLLGVWITLMMKLFSAGVAELMHGGVLAGGTSLFVRALVTSVLMNLSFAPVFMTIHKMTDTFLALRMNGERGSVRTIVHETDWFQFLRGTIFRTILFFWIPAHTVTFLLPSAYQVMTAAILSVFLGIMLSQKAKS